MTEAELIALAEEIASKIRAQRKGQRTAGGRAVGRSANPGGQAVRRAVKSEEPGGTERVLHLERRGAERTAADIAWRGPTVVKAAWNESHGPRRVGDFIDHTLLKPEATQADIDKLCAEAIEHRFASVCVNPVWVDRCAELLAQSPVAVCTVIGFPLGANTAKAKALESADAVSRGAQELDMVAAIGRIKGRQWAAVEDDIRAVVEAAGRTTLVKVIIEAATLTQDEVIKTCALAKEAGADYVKTSTGFHAKGGATVQAVRLMRLVVGDDLGVKAAGGVRDCETALAMIAAGASRIGTSSGVGFSSCLGPGPLPLAELLKQPHAHAASCSSGKCATAAGGSAQPY